MKKYLLLIITAMLVVPGQVSCLILHVPKDYNSIEAGIGAATDGDTVLIAPGEYYEGLNFKGKQITVGGEYLISRDTASISATVIRERLVPLQLCRLPSKTPTDSVVFSQGENENSILVGLTILDEHILITDSVSPTFDKVKVSGTVYPRESHCLNFASVNIRPTAGYDVKGLIFENSRLSVTCSTDSTTVRGNQFIGASLRQNCNEGGVLYDSNTFFDAGFNLHSSDTASFTNNNFFNSRLYAGSTGEARPHITIMNNRADSLSIHFSGTGNCRVNAIIRANEFKNSTIRIGGTGSFFTEAQIERNVFYKNSKTAVFFSVISLSNYACTLKHNTFVGNNVAISGDRETGSISIVNCIFWGNSTDVKNISPRQIRYSLIDSGGFTGSNGNISGYPLFMDSLNRDFHLQAESPCINMGDPAGGIDPDGSRADIGAYPYNPKYVSNQPESFTKTTISSIQIHGSLLTYRPEYSDAFPADLTIYNGKGVVCFNHTLSGKFQSVDLNPVSLESGLYLIKIIDRIQMSTAVIRTP